MDECVFCAEIGHEDPNVFTKSSKGLLAARWDKFPVAPGHVEIIPVRHVRHVKDLTSTEQAELMVFAAEVSKVIESTDLRTLYMHLSAHAINTMSAELLGKAVAKLDDYVNKNPDAYTYGINDGTAAGQSVGHMHLHIIPRWAGDIENPRGGVRNIFAGDPYSIMK